MINLGRFDLVSLRLFVAVASTRRVRFAKPLDQDFIGLDRCTAVRRLIGAQTEPHGRALRVPIEVHSFDAMCRMVAVGLGLGVRDRLAAPARAGRTHRAPRQDVVTLPCGDTR